MRLLSTQVVCELVLQELVGWELAVCGAVLCVLGTHEIVMVNSII